MANYRGINRVANERGICGHILKVLVFSEKQAIRKSKKLYKAVHSTMTKTADIRVADNWGLQEWGIEKNKQNGRYTKDN